jgi:hypothetical protein
VQLNTSEIFHSWHRFPWCDFTVIVKIPTLRLCHPAFEWRSDRQTYRQGSQKKTYPPDKARSTDQMPKILASFTLATSSPLWTLCPRQVMCKFKNLHFFLRIFSFVTLSLLLSSRFPWLGTSHKRKQLRPLSFVIYKTRSVICNPKNYL